MNFSKIQKISSIVPYLSTIVIMLITMFEFKRCKASTKVWVDFVLIIMLSCIAVHILNRYVLSGLFPILNLIASGGVFAVANCLMVDLQEKAAKGV